ncbi:hypothetical protein OSB04_027471 [Centaurea solstitialis]|uniref:Uncharacterized protein n=1 Tax=Centaurea solstitialis TaxID=347529 RepID=A0AA38W6W4_9ASTR|nr:hypothetical protein OSB04_027471 [Centaurea solstitialis]
MSEMKSVMRPLFDLSVEIKRRNVDVFISSGYMAPSAINPLYESLGVYNMASPTDIEEFCSQTEASPHQRVPGHRSTETKLPELSITSRPPTRSSSWRMVMKLEFVWTCTPPEPILEGEKCSKRGLVTDFISLINGKGRICLKLDNLKHPRVWDASIKLESPSGKSCRSITAILQFLAISIIDMVRCG